MCEAPATSKEHVPPKCLFPEAKDLNGDVNLRKELITVPSCELHNSAKSQDDEYLLLGITLNILNNDTALNHFQTKILRAVTRNPRLLEKLGEKQQPVIAVKEDGTAINTLMVSIDNRRFLGSIEHVARGLYFHAFGARFTGRCSLLPDFMLFDGNPQGVALNDKTYAVVSLVKPSFDALPSLGKNPDVFSYSIMDPDEQGRIAMRMKFFGGSSVYVTFLPAAI